MQGLLMPFKGRMPKLGDNVFIAPTASVIGDVEIGANSSIWFGVTVRGDVHEVRIGANTNIQDGSVVHVTGGKFGTYIGSNVTIGHNAIIHACTLEDGAFVGMGAIILDGAVVEGGSMVAAGAIVTPGKRVKRGEMWAGSPAKLLRTISEDEIKAFAWSAPHYVELAGDYLAEAKTR
jgi:carbonic anhydrase/acetyltransferase-like protein (isoleucine patch superfamily)